MRLMATIFVLVCMTGQAQAEWTLLSTADPGNGYTSSSRAYVDYSTLKTDGTKRTVWELWDYDNPQTATGNVTGTYYSMTWLEQIDCAASTNGGLQVGYYSDHMQGGTYLGNIVLPGTMTYIAPNTVAASLQSRICS